MPAAHRYEVRGIGGKTPALEGKYGRKKMALGRAEHVAKTAGYDAVEVVQIEEIGTGEKETVIWREPENETHFIQLPSGTLAECRKIRANSALTRRCRELCQETGVSVEYLGTTTQGGYCYFRLSFGSTIIHPAIISGEMRVYLQGFLAASRVLVLNFSPLPTSR